jgi:hypothetical protein
VTVTVRSPVGVIVEPVATIVYALACFELVTRGFADRVSTPFEEATTRPSSIS